MKNNNLLLTALVAIVVGGAAFFGGMKYQQSQMAATQSAARAQFGSRGGGAARNGARGVVGEIISTDGKTMTLKLADGSSKIVILSSSVAIYKATAGTLADLSTGARVSVFGTDNADGTVSAQNIQLNPVMRK